jgi:pantothenate kinase type III
MTKKTKFLIGSFGAVALTCIVAGGAIASAQSSSTTSFMDRVAQLAGVEPQKLKDSFKQATKEQVDARVQDGSITEEQAVKIKEKIESQNFENFRGLPPLDGRGGKGLMGLKPQMDEVATYLGTTVEDLKTQMKNGKTLLEIAKEKGKSEDDLKSFISQRFDEQLKQAVTDGKLTQSQADTIAENKDEMIQRMLDGKGPGPMGLGRKGMQ